MAGQTWGPTTRPGSGPNATKKLLQGFHRPEPPAPPKAPNVPSLHADMVAARQSREEMATG